MARTGRPRRDIQLRPIDHLEAFCCRQIERIERNLWRRYSRDYDGHKDGRPDPGNHSFLMPPNDHLIRATIWRDCDIETRGSTGAMGRKKHTLSDNVGDDGRYGY